MTRRQCDAVQLVVGGGKLMEQAVKYNGVDIRAIVDTGAYVTVISNKVAREQSWATKGPAPRLVGAGNTISTRRVVELELSITLGRTTKTAKVEVILVSNLSGEMLLVPQLMKALMICIDSAESKLSFKKESTLSGLRIAKDVTLPARSDGIWR